MHDYVTLDRQDDIAVVTLNRPAKYNALALDMLDGLINAARSISRDRSIRAVVIRGAGEAFCSGLDFPSASRQPWRVLRAFARNPFKPRNRFQQAVWVWRELPVPVVAAIHGHCYGGGLQIALAADFRDCAPDAKLSIMESRWGMVPDLTGTVTLRELLPLDVAKDLAMNATVLSGTQAHELNLVTALAQDPFEAALERARKLAQRSPDAVAATKRLFQANWLAPDRRAFRNERQIQLRVLLGNNQRRAMHANLRGEMPHFGPRSWLF